MSEQEIIYRYNKMDTLEDRITVLAELNGCSRDCIGKIVLADKYQANKKVKHIMPEDQKDELIYRMYMFGCSDRFISNYFRESKMFASRWREKRGLVGNVKLGNSKYTVKMKPTWIMMFGERVDDGA